MSDAIIFMAGVGLGTIVSSITLVVAALTDDIRRRERGEK